MKPLTRWIPLILLAALLATAAWWAKLWVPWALSTVTENATVIQGLRNLVQIIAGLGALVSLIAGLLIGRKRDLQDSRRVEAGTYIEHQHVHQAAGAEAESDAEADEKLYLRTKAGVWNTVPLAALGGDQTPEDEVGLDQVYVGLDTTTRIPTAGAKAKTASAARQVHPEGLDEKPLPAITAAAQSPYLVLLGDPGGGKSVVRGGAFGAHPSRVRCAVRFRSSPYVRGDFLGFRVAASPLL